MATEKPSILQVIDSSDRPVLTDGAMGTLLHSRGVSFQNCFDELNLTNPALVAEIHREYIDAGSRIIQTNTFGANRYKLSRHGLENKLKEINTAGVDLARRVVLAAFRDVFIAGDIGPLGVRLAPFGRVQLEEARSAFHEQTCALLNAGVDLIVIETMTDKKEICEAIKAAKECSADLPVLASMTFTRDDRTLLGDSPAKVAQELATCGADIVGVNCSGGPDQILRILRQMKAAAPSARISVMPNAGWPEQVGGRIMYPAAPDYFGEFALAFWQAGACVIGGCCGTTPQHIAAMNKAIQATEPARLFSSVAVSSPEIPEEQKSPAEQPTQFAQKLAAGKFVVSVEMDPPRGLATHKLMAGASLLAESGADVINVADSPMARMRMSPWAVCNLIQRKINVESVLHFPTRGRNLLRVQGDLLAAHAMDVRNVFVVMGDPTSIGDYPDAMNNYDLVPSGLIKLIKQHFNSGVDYAGADIGQPTAFFVGAALNLNPSNPKDEMRNLKRKIDAGADFFLTQPIYDAQLAFNFLKMYTDENGEIKVPILAGILPLSSHRHASFLNQEVPGITIPEKILERMRLAGENGLKEGVTIASELIQSIKPAFQGVYFMPAASRFDAVAEIIETIKG